MTDNDSKFNQSLTIENNTLQTSIILESHILEHLCSYSVYGDDDGEDGDGEDGDGEDGDGKMVMGRR